MVVGSGEQDNHAIYFFFFLKVGPGRDIVGEFSSAVKKSNSMHLGLYHSFFEWFNPLFHLDSKNNFTTRYFFKVGKLKSTNMYSS